MSHDGRKHGERYATVITDDRGNASRLRSLMRDREQLLFAARVDIDVCDAPGNIVHIAGKSEFPMLRKKRQCKHRKGDDCVTSIFSDASKIGTVLVVKMLVLQVNWSIMLCCFAGSSLQS
ncbi:hypothetical protein AVEN_132442-1 [Araneus ventricosus]|uniref:Uncharacterized protein n=1 Tax=Araneus ventricosus TaxID=182803 RepID=A0A4Y2JVY1_ARAVE|nr:hypothetical protein AVEN_132442-1 [Araneus ventricosus]